MDQQPAIKIERLSGFAGFGGPGAHLRSRGALSWSQLPAHERQQLEQLLASRAAPPATTVADGFRYRITTHHLGHPVTIEIAEEHVPATLRDCVQDELI